MQASLLLLLSRMASGSVVTTSLASLDQKKEMVMHEQADTLHTCFYTRTKPRSLSAFFVSFANDHEELARPQSSRALRVWQTDAGCINRLEKFAFF